MSYSFHLKIARFIANLLDNKFQIAGFRFGLDPILGLLPGLGDHIPAVFSFYLIWLAIKLQIEEGVITQMVKNVLLDFAIGIIPIVGDVADFTFKASSKNLHLLEDNLPPGVKVAS